MTQQTKSAAQIVLDEPPPRDDGLERAVLNCFLIDPATIEPAVALGVGRSTFYREAHRRIFTAIRAQQQVGPVDLVTITDRLREQGDLNEVGGASYVTSLLNDVPTPANWQWYAERLLALARRRAIIEYGTEAVRVAQNVDGNPPEIVEAKLAELVEHLPNRSKMISETSDYALYRARDFLLRPLPPVSWRVDELIRDHSVVWLFGLPVTFKTVFTTQLGVAIARGQPFLNHFPTIVGSVLLVQEDMHAADYQELLARLLPHDDAPIYVCPQQGLKLDDADKWQRFRAMALACQPVLVAFDAFYLLHDSEGFTGKELTPILDRLRLLRNELGCTILVIDHSRKEPSGTKTKADPLDLLYGGRAKGAAADCILQLQRVKGSQTQVVLWMHKQRGAPSLEPLKLEYTNSGLVVLGAADEPLTASEELILRWLAGQGDGATRAEIVAGTRLSDRTVKAAIPRLREQGKIEKLDRRGRADLWATPENVADFRQRHDLLPEVTPEDSP